MSYGADVLGTLRQVGRDYVSKILKGANPADLPIQRPNKFALVINLKTAKALGLDVPSTLVALADKVERVGCGGRSGAGWGLQSVALRDERSDPRKEQQHVER
jgi:ABC transporter substrate binding protein